MDNLQTWLTLYRDWAEKWKQTGESYHLHRAEGLLVAISDMLRGQPEYGSKSSGREDTGEA